MVGARAGDILDAARVQLGWDVPELWLRCCGLGGTATLRDLASFLGGAARPSDPQYDVIAQALNDEFIDRGLDHPVPYSEDVPG